MLICNPPNCVHVEAYNGVSMKAIWYSVESCVSSVYYEPLTGIFKCNLKMAKGKHIEMFVYFEG